jgi:hypothetical protein
MRPVVDPMKARSGAHNSGLRLCPQGFSAPANPPDLFVAVQNFRGNVMGASAGSRVKNAAIRPDHQAHSVPAKSAVASEKIA